MKTEAGEPRQEITEFRLETFNRADTLYNRSPVQYIALRLPFLPTQLLLERPL